SRSCGWPPLTCSTGCADTIAGTRMMRIRQVRPEFWSDETMASLPDPVRLFYIGLWGIADDAGWLEWQPMRIGALLYPYRQPRHREESLRKWAVSLESAGR